MRSFIKNPEILRKLIELGLDTSHTDAKGYTCIFEHYRDPEGLTELINAGCDINHVDSRGRNILFLPLPRSFIHSNRCRMQCQPY